MSTDRRPVEDRLTLALAQTARRVVRDEEVPPALEVPATVHSLRARTNRHLPLLAAAAVVLTVLGVALAANATHHNSAPQPGNSTPVSPSPAPSTVTDTTTPSPSPALPVVDPRSAALRNATIDIPPFAGVTGACPGGPTTFSNDVANAASNAGSQNVYHLWVPPMPQYFRFGNPVWGDVDGRPGEEVLVEVSCDGGGSLHPYQLLALKPEGTNAFRTLGTVNYGAPDNGDTSYWDFDTATVRFDGRTILLDVRGPEVSNGEPIANQQTRGFRFENGTFAQVSGPTAVSKPQTNIHAIDPRNTFTLIPELSTCLACNDTYANYANFVDGHAHAIQPTQQPDGNFTFDTYDFTIDAATYIPISADQPDALLVTLTQQKNGGQPKQAVVQLFASDGFQISATTPVVISGENGVTGIQNVAYDQHAGVGGVVTIVVKTASGLQSRTYEFDTQALRWTRTK